MIHINNKSIQALVKKIAEERKQDHISNLREEDRDVANSIFQAELEVKEGIPGAPERLEAMILERFEKKSTPA
jgi:hypothetical protein